MLGPQDQTDITIIFSIEHQGLTAQVSIHHQGMTGGNFPQFCNLISPWLSYYLTKAFVSYKFNQLHPF